MHRYRAPGRVNLIGEHTDYNDGFVMPVAIDRHTTARASPRGDRVVHAESPGYGPAVDIDLDAPGGGPMGAWSDDVRGVAAVLERRGHALQGTDLQISSTVPAGAGLSSSAALAVAVGAALLARSGRPIDRT
jgi:galactokinase